MSTRKQAQDALKSLVKVVEGKFGHDQPGRVEQLKAHAATLGMTIDSLYDTTDEEPGDG